MVANKTSGLGDAFWVDGYDLSGDIGSLSSIHGGPAALELTGINKSAPERVGGLRDGGIEFSAWFDPGTAQSHPVLAALPTGDRIATYAHQPGLGIGAQCACVVGKQINYDGNRGQDGSFPLSTSVQANNYGLEWGDLLTVGTNGVRTDTTATNGASLDFGATSTLFGGQAYLQVFSVTGTSVTVKLQDSADNSTFADITGAAFIAATGRGSQRLQLASNATVRRYVRAVTTGTFTNAQFAVVFVRNLVATVF